MVATLFAPDGDEYWRSTSDAWTYLPSDKLPDDYKCVLVAEIQRESDPDYDNVAIGYLLKGNWYRDGVPQRRIEHPYAWRPQEGPPPRRP